MAISLTTLNGTDSLASSRITINDNFSTVLDALNDVLSIIDIATGKINNYGYGSNNDMETEDLIVRGSVGGGISVITGDITLNNGNVSVANSGYFEIGSGTGVKIEKITKNLTSGNIPTWNFSGVGSTGASGPIGYMTVPRLNTATIDDIQLPQLGALVYDIDTNELKVCTASGATGTWAACN
jgi:hypothetical protein